MYGGKRREESVGILKSVAFNPSSSRPPTLRLSEILLSLITDYI